MGETETGIVLVRKRRMLYKSSMAETSSQVIKLVYLNAASPFIAT